MSSTFEKVFRNKAVLITGHTGFKGAWLTATLKLIGADVTGYSLSAPTDTSLFEQLDIKTKINHIEADITDRDRMKAELKNSPLKDMYQQWLNNLHQQ